METVPKWDTHRNVPRWDISPKFGRLMLIELFILNLGIIITVMGLILLTLIA